MTTAMTLTWLAHLLLLLAAATALAEYSRDLEVSEGAPVGTKIGYVGDGAAPDSGPPYLIVPVGSHVDTDLTIDQNTGEIRTKVPLDRETRASYSLVAIPMSGDNVKVLVKVLDENDNAPTFPTRVMHIEFPENTPRDVKRTLYPAKDLDLDVFNTQRYNIVSGNTNNAFRLSSHRERDGVLYLDLQINGYLDRETTPAYQLVIEALDGGTPPLRGEMTVNITIQDVNDNPPVFNQSRYFATVPENATIGTSVLQVIASDADAEDNSLVEYTINRRQSDRDSMFRIDSTSGVISVNKPLDYEVKELHELVIVAKDNGLQPLEATAFVSIRVTDVNDNQPTINVIFLSDDATAKISESAQPGEFVARISVHDPDSSADYSNINVTLSGGEGRFGLTTRDNIIYLMVVSLPLDRELQPNYTLDVVATDTGSPPLHASKTIQLQVTDINDNAPEFLKQIYYANVMEVSDPGTSVIQVVATDKDEGNNSAVTYSLRESPETHSGWFQIDARSGLVTTRVHVDCETDPLPRLTVVATDSGFPPLSSSVTVLVTIHDVNDNEPIFDQSFYNVSVVENEKEGRCILKVSHVTAVRFCDSREIRKDVSATDPDCGVNAVVNYTLGDGSGKLKEFKVRSDTGEICINSPLDYETRNVYEFPVIATDRGGLSTTAMVKIQITDINDNRPVFYPPEYYVSLRESASSSANTPIVVVAATDSDSGKFGTITYNIVAGNEAGLFRIERKTGEIFLSNPSLLTARGQAYQRLNISAVDGGNLKSLKDAEVFVSVIDSAQRPPIFEHSRYTFSVSENVRRGTTIGSVKAAVFDSAGRGGVRYSINSGDPDGYFTIDPTTGAIIASSNLDHESKANVLLNIQATSGDPPVYGHTQVNIEIDDVNDNTPEFESSTVRISVPENVEIGLPLYSAHAIDRDSGENGVVRYKIANNPHGGLFKVDAMLGDLTISRHLDYETSQRHTLVISASDMGVPPLSANLTVFLEVQDVNDNPPVFERNEYSLSVLESLPVNTQILQLTAVDADTGNNARITYRLLTPNNSDTATQEVFGIFPNSGWLYLRANLDRESKDRFVLVVAATDNGTPSEMATTKVLVDVLDANDNDPIFARDSYEFSVEENLRRGSGVGRVVARDDDSGVNAAIRYGLIPGNSSFVIDEVTGEITTKDVLDREAKPTHDLVVEASDSGTPSRSARVAIKILVTDVNDNTPEIIDPQEDVISVREEQPAGTEVARIRAVDADNGNNASITYSLVKNRDSEGVFRIDPTSGVVRTNQVLDHEEKPIYRLTVAATDAGQPPKQSVRTLRIEVLDVNDNRPTFTSSSLVFSVEEDASIGHVVGSIAVTQQLASEENSLTDGFVTYTLSSLGAADEAPFQVDRNTGTLVVAKRLDRELQSDYRLEVRALDSSSLNNPQSSAVTVTVHVMDVNDNAPQWQQDPVTIPINEHVEVGSTVFNLTAADVDSGANGQVRYSMQHDTFAIDSLTGTVRLTSWLDYESTHEYTLVVTATDQCRNLSRRLSTSLTVRIIVTDFNDNSPSFVVPSPATVHIDDANSVVGMTLAHVIAVDLDSGDNGRVTYVISSGNEGGVFALGYDTGALTLTKTLPASAKSFVLNITASDHGSPTLHATLQLKLYVLGSVKSSSKLLESQYVANVAEDVAVGAVVATVSVRSSVVADNLTFILPPGVADDTFDILSPSGEVVTKKPLDREKLDAYILPVYVSASTRSSSIFDTTTLLVNIADVNDNAPMFLPGSCYRLSVPENSDTAVIHTVIAEDVDQGANGELSYAITGGNGGNKFSIDSTTGAITAKQLDRESRSRYSLTVMARDHGAGSTSLHTTCNITIYVEDQNDNDPKFDLSKYAVELKEDVAIDTFVVKVHASDADVGVNGRIVYSLANESDALFRVDNKTGIITTAGLFDRERQNLYNFLVVATDTGRYNARSQSVPVTVKITDVNDNSPIFTKHPFKAKVTPYIQPGQMILKVTANDLDEATNSEIVYSILDDDANGGKFRINPNTGILTTTQSLASNKGKVSYLNILARDKGNPPRSSTGLIEIMVGDLSDGSPSLRFQNATYLVALSENAGQFQEVVQVAAVRTDGRRQKITYAIGSGNEDNGFVINSSSGVIQVRQPQKLDYELHKELLLVVEAKTEGNPELHAFCNVLVRIDDENDNAPKFTQQQYSASVREGDKKGAFVLQVMAFDADEGANSRILYHIVDGNRDNAFKIEPAFSGTLKTNIVLDREIRDLYRLTVIATDEGIPQMTGTARILINVVDINDNQPTFPPHSIITVKEDTPIGTVLTIVTANDVDTFPPLTYTFSNNNKNDNDLHYFSIDRYSGKVVLKKHLDFEQWQECRLEIVASDAAHEAHTSLTIKVIDVNDNAPVFQQASYVASLPDGNAASSSLVEIATVNATDADTDLNGKLVFSLVNPVPGFVIGEEDGVLRTNLSSASSRAEDILLTIKATDKGEPPLHSFVPVRIRTNYGSGQGMKPTNKLDYQINIAENTTRGTTITHLAPLSDLAASFRIIEGNDKGLFAIVSNPTGALILLKSLDRELQASHSLKISDSDENLSMVHVSVVVDDANDNAPVFSTTDNEVSISESLTVGAEVTSILATDADQAGTPNSAVEYEITSGNDDASFRIDSITGMVYVNNSLDYDSGDIEYKLVVRACDKGEPVLCTLSAFSVMLQDENDNAPQFPVGEYLEFVTENEPAGASVFTACATDLDRSSRFGSVNYSIVGASNELDNSWKLFEIDATSGVVTTATVFDYELRSRYSFMVQAMDVGGKFSLVRVRVEIEGRDEFHPQFTERTYKMSLPTSSALPAGYVVGRVTATDRDKGPDGRVVYQLSTQHSLFKVNRTTGEVLVRKKSLLHETGREISLVITASSGKQGSLTNMTVVEVILDPLADPGTNLAVNSTASGSGLADWVLGLLIAVLLLIITFGAVFVYLHMRNKRHSQPNKPSLSSEPVSTATTNNYVDASAFDTIPIRAAGVQAQFAQPPKYDEIPPYAAAASSNSGAATTSELSGSEQSGSSGRGSAEDDGEDEEIRMINEGPLQRDSGIHRHNDDDDDNLSDVSVRNTQEYLARLGIVNSSSGQALKAARLGADARVAGTSKESVHLHHQPLDNLNRMFDDEAKEHDDLTNLIYAKLNDVTGSDRASSSNEATTVNPSTSMLALGGYADAVVTHHQPSMNGSLSSIVHSEEELAGSYNWDYLLDWGPQYQPLAHVFSEIARLKDDTASVHSGASGTSSVKSKSSVHVKTVPPPLITGVAPRALLSGRGAASSGGHHHGHGQMVLLPRSPISHDASGATFSSATAMSPSFSPSLSPLATKSPSVSPLVAPGLSASQHVMARQQQVVGVRNKAVVDAEMRI